MNEVIVFNQWINLMPFGQIALFTILLIILKVLLQSRDQIKTVMHSQKVMKEELDKHQVRDENSFKVVTTSVDQVQDQLELLNVRAPVTR